MILSKLTLHTKYQTIYFILGYKLVNLINPLQLFKFVPIFIPFPQYLVNPQPFHYFCCGRILFQFTFLLNAVIVWI